MRLGQPTGQGSLGLDFFLLFEGLLCSPLGVFKNTKRWNLLGSVAAPILMHMYSKDKNFF